MIIVKATKDSEAGVMLAGEGLHPSSMGARVRFSGDKRAVVDGPFAETKELIAGFWLWEVQSKEEAIEWAKRCPNPHHGDCEIEIRHNSRHLGARAVAEGTRFPTSVRAGVPSGRFIAASWEGMKPLLKKI